MSYGSLKRKKEKTHTHAHRRQLNIIFLDVLDYSQYSDTNIVNCFFHENSNLCEKAKLSC